MKTASSGEGQVRRRLTDQAVFDIRLDAQADLVA